MRLREQARRTCEAIMKEVKKHQATNVTLVMRNKHPSVQFVVDGRTGFVTFTLTNTDARAHYNQISEARKVCRRLMDGSAEHENVCRQVI